MGAVRESVGYFVPPRPPCRGGSLECLPRSKGTQTQSRPVFSFLRSRSRLGFVVGFPPARMWGACPPLLFAAERSTRCSVACRLILLLVSLLPHGRRPPPQKKCLGVLDEFLRTENDPSSRHTHTHPRERKKKRTRCCAPADSCRNGLQSSFAIRRVFWVTVLGG